MKILIIFKKVLMNKKSILIFIILILGCKKSFSKIPETALAWPLELTKPSEFIVFIAGYDTDNNSYYANAKSYFEAQNFQVIDSLFSLAEIINFLNKTDSKTFSNIHIVSHSNPWLGMALKTTKNGERITVNTLAKYKADIPILSKGIDESTQIIFHSCGLGENKTLMQAIKTCFTMPHKVNAPKIIASLFFNVFGGKYAGHYLAKPYYAYYPTGESLGPLALSKDFKVSYPKSSINWFKAIKTRKETRLAEVYSYKFNIPVQYEFTFNNKKEIPRFKDRNDIMDWVSESPEIATTLYGFNIPIEKYRWKSEILGNTLIIKGKTTVLCVLEPILQKNDATEYSIANVNNTCLYQKL